MIKISNANPGDIIEVKWNTSEILDFINIGDEITVAVNNYPSCCIFYHKDGRYLVDGDTANKITGDKIN